MRNFFDFFGLPCRLTIDLHELEAKYITKFSDFSESDSESDEVNKGYEILKNPLKRVDHFFLLKNFTPNEDADKDFLMFFFELNEKIENISSDAEAMEEKYFEILGDIDDILAKIQDFFDNNSSETHDNVSNLYLRLKYLNRILENHFN